MKINEVLQPSKKSIFESLSQDTDHTFNEETLKEISEVIVNSKFEEMTIESFLNKLEEW